MPSAPFFESDPVPNLLVHPIVLANTLTGTRQGVEVSPNWRVTRRWTVSPGYSFLNMNLRTASASLDTVIMANTEGPNPDHQAQLRSHVELPRDFSWDTNAYFFDSLPVQPVRSYTRLIRRWAGGLRKESNCIWWDKTFCKINTKSLTISCRASIRHWSRAAPMQNHLAILIEQPVEASLLGAILLFI